MQDTCNDKLPEPQENSCSHNYTLKVPHYTIKDGMLFKNGSYYGDVVYADSLCIQVKCKSDNQYMNGQILTIHLR